MSDRMDAKLRELTYRLIEMAPDAPPFPEESMVQLKPTPRPASPARRRPLVWAAAAAVIALLVVGVPLVLFGPASDPSPTTVPPASITAPDDVAPTTVPDEVAPTTVPDDVESTVFVEYSVYYFADDMPTRSGDPALVAVGRRLAAPGPLDALSADLRVAQAVGSLLSRPPEDNFTTSVPSGSDGIVVSVAGGVATIDFPAAFESGGGTASMTARLAQVVFTATQFHDVDSVLFVIDGEVAEVFSGEGLILDGPQARADYYRADQLIYVDTPAIGSAVVSPFTITGDSNTFEATVEYEVTAGDGTVLDSGFTTATCGNGCWGEFSIESTFEATSNISGFVNIFETSAESGVRQHVLRYPVLLLASDAPSGPPEEAVVPATEDEAAVMDSLVTFARTGSADDFARIPLADEVALGLGPDIVRTVPAADLADPVAWVMDVDLFRARSGTTSIFNLFAANRPRRIITGEHVHCASPPVPAPAGLEDLTRISTQPTDATSCLEWFTVDLFVGGDGQIVAITLDLYEP